MKVSELTPEEREEVIRMMKEHYPDFELRDDAPTPTMTSESEPTKKAAKKGVK